MTVTSETAELRLRDYRSPQEVADALPGMTTAILAQHRFKGTGPAYMKPSVKTVLYDWADVVEWLEGTKRTGTSSEAG